ncbi:DNA polymerase ligase N-terminal domain-containing protein [[Actinomadura] parvosata]|uniref:DNA polymerase ligase N-terminal domain-containing protein n=1 Tax=[Actinomadura] parvosata TaxID=1955412 RepID=UPI001E461E42|nr:DNA polymerase ligase N-terminal domain-containing protein [Nonomuraea sp. ATCC 55076]
MSDKLSKYRSKRDPNRTPEPVPDTPSPDGTSDGRAFVIQEHHARSLHWDLRLERDGVLVSWAVPKGLPADPDTNHLAVHTEDHPMEYLTFHGEIPKGEYGGGTMTVWDTGTYETEKWSDREVKVVLRGERASGRFVLFRTRGKNWMIHRMGAPVRDPFPPLTPMLPTDRTRPRRTPRPTPSSSRGAGAASSSPSTAAARTRPATTRGCAAWRSRSAAAPPSWTAKWPRSAARSSSSSTTSCTTTATPS